MMVTVHCNQQIEQRRRARERRDLPRHIEHAEEVVALLSSIEDPDDRQERALDKARKRAARLTARLEQITSEPDPVAIETRELTAEERADNRADAAVERRDLQHEARQRRG